MADIKTRDTVKGTIKTLDKAAVAGQKMKQAYIATKDKAEREEVVPIMLVSGVRRSWETARSRLARRDS